MLEDALGRFVTGALWGAGAGLVLTVTRGGGDGLRDLARGVVKGYLTIADKVQESTAEVREQFEDLAAEVRTERETGSAQDAG